MKVTYKTIFAENLEEFNNHCNTMANLGYIPIYPPIINEVSLISEGYGRQATFYYQQFKKEIK